MRLAAYLSQTYWGSPGGVTTQDKYVHELWFITYCFAIPLGLLVGGLILWSALRYRKRPGNERRPAQFQYHIPIEAAYTLIPIAIVAVIFSFMYGAENKEDAVSKHPALVVKVEGFQWGWRFTYPNGHQEVGSYSSNPNINDDSTLPVLYLPSHETVQLDLKADDVNHSFYVPEFLFQRDMIPGVTNNIDVNISRNSGRWIGECTQLCGTYHAYMRFEVEAMPPSSFNTWMAHQKPNSITTAGSA